VSKRDALDVSITLEQVLPAGQTATPSDATAGRLAGATAVVPSVPAPNPVARVPGDPL
jgi:hypothetical protein